MGRSLDISIEVSSWNPCGTRAASCSYQSIERLACSGPALHDPKVSFTPRWRSCRLGGGTFD
jgi:hypothetical protein